MPCATDLACSIAAAQPAGLLGEILLVLALAVFVVYVCQRLRVPTVVGLLATGALVGPGVLGWIDDQREIERIAEIGVVLLLFGIGLEFSVRDLLRMRALVFGAGTAQLLITAAAVGGGLVLFGVPAGTAFFFGALVALSSTALVLNLLDARGEMSSPHGRTMLAILIYQDLMVVVLLLLVPFLAGKGEGASELLLTIAKALGVIVGMLLVATRLLPWIFERIVRTRSRELFTITTLVAALGTAYLTGLAGLSVALGAFLAGIVISESEYAPQIVSEIAPMRDGLSSLFFISLGMLFDPAIVADRPLMVLALIAGILVLKAVVAGGVTWVFGLGARVALLVGLGLAQVGEFSFVLAQEGWEAGLIDEDAHALFFLVSVVTLAMTPLAVPLGQRIAGRAGGRFSQARPSPRAAAALGLGSERGVGTLADHVVIVGYGINGRNVARVLEGLEVPYVVVELNPHTVRTQQELGVPIHYGDATRRAVLEHLGVARARAVVVAIADPAATRQAVAMARSLNSDAYILVRTRLLAEVEPLRQLGASDVVPEEFETSLELAGRLMAVYGATSAAVMREKSRLRRERYDFLRGEERAVPREMETLEDLLGAMDVEIVPLATGHHAVGRSARELRLRNESGATILAVAGRDGLDANPGPDRVLVEGDRVVLGGRADQVRQARSLLESGRTAATNPPAPADET